MEECYYITNLRVWTYLQIFLKAFFNSQWQILDSWKDLQIFQLLTWTSQGGWANEADISKEIQSDVLP